MGVMLERSRLAEDLLDVIGFCCGRLPGGMALSIVLVGVLMGAATGIVGATVVTLGLLTLPVFLKRNYNKPFACGVIRSEEHTSELQSLMRISYAVFCLKKKKIKKYNSSEKQTTYTK